MPKFTAALYLLPDVLYDYVPNVMNKSDRLQDDQRKYLNSDTAMT
jgi:hypothetical protein